VTVIRQFSKAESPAIRQWRNWLMIHDAVALVRHSKIADGLPLFVQEQSCSEHHSNG